MKLCECETLSLSQHPICIESSNNKSLCLSLWRIWTIVLTWIGQHLVLYLVMMMWQRREKIKRRRGHLHYTELQRVIKDRRVRYLCRVWNMRRWQSSLLFSYSTGSRLVFTRFVVPDVTLKLKLLGWVRKGWDRMKGDRDHLLWPTQEPPPNREKQWDLIFLNFWEGHVTLLQYSSILPDITNLALTRIRPTNQW